MTQKTHIIPPKAFYLVRHGQSEANLKRVAAGGRLDSPLTELGINQAKELASVIHHLPVKPSRIYHSPMQRAKHTAEHINTMLKLDMVEIDPLREHFYGDWENVSWEIIKPLWAQGMNPPNGETFDEFALRIQETLNHIHSNDHDAPPMLVCHGGVFHSIGHLYGIELGKIDNCALYHFAPAPTKENFPWDVTIFTPCPVNGLRTQSFQG
jgi:broad specificity phosphatase PhoE